MPVSNSPDIGLCLREGWELYLRRPGLLSGATLVAGVINIAASMIPFATLVTYPLLLAGLYTMIMRIDAGESVALANLADGLPRFAPLLIASALISLLVTLGVILLVLPGIYLAIAYGFTTINIIDRDMDAWPAMESSRRVITAHFFPYLGLVLIMLVLVILGSLPLGLGLLVAFPVCLGAQYRFYLGLTPRDGIAAVT